MIPLDRLRQITDRFQYLEAAMATGDSSTDIAALSKEYSDLRPVVEQIEAYQQLLNDLDEAKEMKNRMATPASFRSPVLTAHCFPNLSFLKVRPE